MLKKIKVQRSFDVPVVGVKIFAIGDALLVRIVFTIVVQQTHICLANGNNSIRVVGYLHVNCSHVFLCLMTAARTINSLYIKNELEEEDFNSLIAALVIRLA